MTTRNIRCDLIHNKILGNILLDVLYMLASITADIFFTRLGLDAILVASFRTIE